MAFEAIANRMLNRSNSRSVQVGWLLQTAHASFVWDTPRPFQRNEKRPPDSKAVGHCPAVSDFENKLVEVCCPFDLRLGIRQGESGGLDVVNRLGESSGVTAPVLSRMLMISPPSQWRHPKRPVLQIRTPYTFLSDDTVYMSQTPPFMDYRITQWPGVVISGRFPIHIWPRSLSWSFEWHDIERDLILERGQPWFYCRFETARPQQSVHMIEATLTPAVKEYLAGIEGTASYTSRTFSLFSIAKQRRPKQLLFKVDRNKA